MARRVSAIPIQRELASDVKLELIDSPAPGRSRGCEERANACPSADDLFDFCSCRLPSARTLAVQQHIDVCPSCIDVVILALNDWEVRPPVEWLEVASNFHGGGCVDGRYEIVRFLASGGMGEVYEAIDRQTSKRVALKAVLAAASDNREMLRGFRREARLARAIRHPNVCQVLWVPSSDIAARLNVPYFTMELIDGDTLQQRLASGPLPLPQALDIARQLLLGIRAIHRAGVLHLDIKTNNVMLRRGPMLQAVIVDFGLARRMTSLARCERARPLTGSLPYLPPEQILGQIPTVQNDIFAFGVVLFQMLTGTLPFPSTSAGASLAERLTATAPAPSQIVSALPEGIDEIMRRCLAARAQRFSDVEAVLGALSDVSIESAARAHHLESRIGTIAPATVPHC